jgi:hypothetical protein
VVREALFGPVCGDLTDTNSLIFKRILCVHRYRYHDGEPKGLQFLNDADSKLQFEHPFGIDGVTGVIIWGDEESTHGCNDCRSELLKWFSKHNAIFDGDATTTTTRAAASPQHARARGITLKKPPIPRDGPIPKCVARK